MSKDDKETYNYCTFIKNDTQNSKSICIAETIHEEPTFNYRLCVKKSGEKILQRQWISYKNLGENYKTEWRDVEEAIEND